MPDAPINQYVNSWGSPYYLPYGNMFGYPNMEAWNRLAQMAYAPVQTEYGILVPENEPLPFNSQQTRANVAPISYVPYQEAAAVQPAQPQSSDMLSGLADFLPRSLLLVLAKWSSFISSLLSILALGSAITTALCSMTPLCSITFAPLRNSIFGEKYVEDSAANQERIQQTAAALNAATEKYGTLAENTGNAAKIESH